MSNVSLDSTLHHCASIVILDVALPTRFGKVMVLREALLSEVLDSIVISVSEEVVKLLRLSMVLQLIHETRTVAFHLLLSGDC